MFITANKYENELTLTLRDFMKCGSKHFREDRSERKQVIDRLAVDDAIDNVFVVDNGDVRGKELHVVSEQGLIYILSKDSVEKCKFNGALITVLIARPNQVIRLYRACKLYAPSKIIKKCRLHQELALNEK